MEAKRNNIYNWLPVIIRSVTVTNCFIYAFLKYNQNYPGHIISNPFSGSLGIIGRSALYSICGLFIAFIYYPFSAVVINSGLGWINCFMIKDVMGKA